MWQLGSFSFVATTQKTASTSSMQEAIVSVLVIGPMKNLMFGGGEEAKVGFWAWSLYLDRA
jgi:hypothetical protein